MNNDIARTWQLFKAPDAIVEVRALGCQGKHKAWTGWASGVVSGYFDDETAFVDCVQSLDKSGKPGGIYVTLNPVHPDLLARAANRLAGIRKHSPTTEDKDILGRRWLLLDFDPVRPAGISATKEEICEALGQAQHVAQWLGARDWPAPLLAHSGNGIHLLYRIDLHTGTGDVLKGLLHCLHDLFSTDTVKLDTTVYNASRIVKLYGTVARKGDATPDRPHRRSAILEGYDEKLNG